MTHSQTPFHFHKHGFAIFSGKVLNTALITEAYFGAQHVVKGTFDTGISPLAMIDTNNPTKIQRIAQIHLANHALYRLVTHPQLGQLAASATGAKTVKIWGTQLYLKPAHSENGGIIGYHRDSEHMPYFEKGAVTAWLPLHFFPEDAGLLHFVRGSHRWSKSTSFSGAEQQNRSTQKAQLQAFYQNQDWKEVASAHQPGGISFHHQDVLHGSPANTSSTNRWALGIGLLLDDYQVNPKTNDYGFANILNDEHVCPIIYPK